jgi:hypothetical protein
MIVCGLIFILFNDASLQPWNKPPKKYEEIKQKDEDANFTEVMMMKQKEEEFERKM